MSDSSTKVNPPAYVSFGAFVSFINKLRETGVPSRIDRSLLGNQSGSLISALLAALRSFDLVDEAQRPTQMMRDLVVAPDEQRKGVYKQLFEQGYGALLADQDFHLETATTAQLAQKFRELGMGGSTIAKCIGFFLNLAKAADVKVSPHLKAPAAPRPMGRKTQKTSAKKDVETDADATAAAEPSAEGDDEDVERFEIPIPGKPSVRVIVPRNLDGDDWEMLQSMITVYIKRWKGFKPEGANP